MWDRLWECAYYRGIEVDTSVVRPGGPARKVNQQHSRTG